MCSSNLIVPLTYLINLCLETTTFPDVLKTAIVTPIFKNKGLKSDINNYRPISLTSIIAKLLEKTIKKRMTDFLGKSRFLANHQYGFR